MVEDPRIGLSSDTMLEDKTIPGPSTINGSFWLRWLLNTHLHKNESKILTAKVKF